MTEDHDNFFRGACYGLALSVALWGAGFLLVSWMMRY